MQIKKYLSIFLTATIMSSQLCAYADWRISDTEYSEMLAMVDNTNSDTGIKIIINGKEVPTDQAPIFAEDNTLVVPIRAIAEGLGSNVEWDESNKTAIVQRGLDTSVFQIGNKRAYAKQIYPLELEARIVNERTLIPLRTISDIFGADATYDSNRKEVIVTCDDLSDNNILKEVRTKGFTNFNYFGDTFLGEHDDFEVAVGKVLGNIGDFGKKLLTLEITNYEEDSYKESMEKILSNITTPNIVESALPAAWEEKIFKDLQKTNNITYEELKKSWEKKWSGLDSEGNQTQTFELSNWDEAALGKYMKAFGEGLETFNDTVKWTDFTAKELGYLFADYTQQQMYIDVFNNAINDNDTEMKSAVEKLQKEYANGYSKTLSEAGDMLKGELTSIMSKEFWNAISDVVGGGGVGTLYSLSTFAIEKGTDIVGIKDYADNTISAMTIMGIAYNLRWHFDELLDNLYDPITDTVSKDATDEDWIKLQNTFEVTKAAFIEAYKAMLAATDDEVEKVYLKEQLGLLERIHIGAGLPARAENMFYLDEKINNKTYEGSAPGVVTSDGPYMYFPLNGYIYREDIDGNNRIPVYRKVFYEYEDKKYLEQYKYSDIQCKNGKLYGKGEPIYAGLGVNNNSFEIDVSELSIKRTTSEDNFIRRNIGDVSDTSKKFLSSSNYQKYLNNIWCTSRNIIPMGTHSLYVHYENWKPVKLIPDVDAYCVYNGYVYYTVDGNLYRFDVKWHDSQLLVENITQKLSLGDIYEINTVGNWIYLYRHSDLFHMGKLYRARIGDYVFEELTETEEDKAQYTTNRIIGQTNIDTSDNTSNIEETIPQIPTEKPVETITVGDVPLKDISVDLGYDTVNFSASDYSQMLDIDFDSDGIPEKLVSYNNDYAGMFVIFALQNGEYKEIGAFGDSMTYTLESNSDGYYIKRFGRTSTSSSNTIYRLENGNFVERTSFARSVNKDSLPYVTTYFINETTVTEDEYNEISTTYNNTIIASTNLASFPVGQ